MAVNQCSLIALDMKVVAIPVPVEIESIVKREKNAAVATMNAPCRHQLMPKLQGVNAPRLPLDQEPCNGVPVWCSMCGEPLTKR